MSVSIRPNLVFIPIIFFFIFLFQNYKTFKNIKTLKFFFGVFIVFVINILPYLLQNKLNLFIDGAIITPALYSSVGGNDVLTNSINLFKNSMFPLNEPIFFFRLIFWIMSPIITFAIFLNFLKDRKNLNQKIFLIYLLAIIIPILFSGHAPEHYLYQILPFALLSIFFLKFSKFQDKFKIILKTYFFAFLIIVLINCFLSYKNLYLKKKYPNKYATTSEKIFEVINKYDIEKSIYAYRYHVLFLLFDTYPKSRYIHPPNIFKKEYILLNDNTNAQKEADKYFYNDDPVNFIVVKDPLIYFLNNFYKEFSKDDFQDKKLIKKKFKKYSKVKKISDNYEFLEKVDNINIYILKRKF